MLCVTNHQADIMHRDGEGYIPAVSWATKCK